MSLFFSTVIFLFKKGTKIHTIIIHNNCMYFCILLLFTYYYSKFANLIKTIYKKFLFELNKKKLF